MTEFLVSSFWFLGFWLLATDNRAQFDLRYWVRYNANLNTMTYNM